MFARKNYFKKAVGGKPISTAKVFNHWRHYKAKVAVCGCIILNEDLTKVFINDVLLYFIGNNTN